MRSEEELIEQGRRLRQLREDGHYSQADIAKQLRVRERTVSNWEHGRHDPGVTHLRKLANFYGVDPSWIENEQAKIALTPDLMEVLSRQGQLLQDIDQKLDRLAQPAQLMPRYLDALERLDEIVQQLIGSVPALAPQSDAPDSPAATRGQRR